MATPATDTRETALSKEKLRLLETLFQQDQALIAAEQNASAARIAKDQTTQRLHQVSAELAGIYWARTKFATGQKPAQEGEG